MDGYTIRKTTTDDLSKIQNWLKEVDSRENPFSRNWTVIVNGHKDGNLTALIREDDSFPIAFCLLGNMEIVILAVKHDLQRKGFGSHFVQQIIAQAYGKDWIGLRCECAPSSSQSFWEKVGFVLAEGVSGSRVRVALPLPKEHDLPEGKRHKITISFEETKCQLKQLFQCDAVEVDGNYLLAKDFSKYVPDGNRQLEIHCDEKQLFAKKSKYVTEAGGERDINWVRVRKVFTEQLVTQQP